MEIFKGEALTVGQLKKALEGVPDDTEIGQSVLGMQGFVQKVNGLAFFKSAGLLSFDADKRGGSFNDEEFEETDAEIIAIAE